MPSASAVDELTGSAFAPCAEKKSSASSSATCSRPLMNSCTRRTSSGGGSAPSRQKRREASSGMESTARSHMAAACDSTSDWCATARRSRSRRIERKLRPAASPSGRWSEIHTPFTKSWPACSSPSSSSPSSHEKECRGGRRNRKRDACTRISASESGSMVVHVSPSPSSSAESARPPTLSSSTSSSSSSPLISAVASPALRGHTSTVSTRAPNAGSSRRANAHSSSRVCMATCRPSRRSARAPTLSPSPNWPIAACDDRPLSEHPSRSTRRSSATLWLISVSRCRRAL
mmetsp:Transcript_16350/g.42361  ORF Transcript_16350/g.42361 Transcript_16350/m.42361 type:complete len:289 (+) Transcript_16350:1889-2755(+)